MSRPQTETATAQEGTAAHGNGNGVVAAAKESVSSPGRARSVVVARYEYTNNTSVEKKRSSSARKKRHGMRHASRKKIEEVVTQMEKQEQERLKEKGVIIAKQKAPVGVVKNFRQVTGLPNFYRCARTDDLADRLGVPRKSLSAAEKMILYKAGLILDLRSPSEVKHEKITKWMDEAPGGKITMASGNGDEGLVTNEKRGMLIIEVLGPKDFSSYAEQNWLTSAQEIIQLSFYKAVDGTKLHNMRVDALNKRGVVGLNEVILESGKTHLCRALKAITLHLEKKGEDLLRPIVINCAQGKDRTGMLVMLLQSIIGLSDQDIVNDYHASELLIDFSKGEKQDDKDNIPTRPGKLDRATMRRAPKSAMVETLAYIREKYGSVSPGYFQAIGFDDAWRIRLVTALLLDMDRQKQPRRSRNSRL
eukprot:scaffold528_cov165-Amphora_coffeaeformis.AAC.61